MAHYTYTDRMAGPMLYTTTGLRLGFASFGRPFPVHAGEVIFECEASDILAADEKLLADTGLVASKQASVCCAIS